MHQFFKESQIRQLPLSSRLPDLNSIEHVWDVIARLREPASRLFAELQQRVQEEKNEIICHNLITAFT